MFTGIIEEIGVIRGIRRSSAGARKLYIECKAVLEDLKLGDSLAVNGVCLTIVEKGKGKAAVEVVEETIKKTSLGNLNSGGPVNLERAASLNSRLGGHLVQGHVDATGKVVSIEKLPMSWMFRFRIPKTLMKYIIPVGSIAVNGVSLTVAEKLSDSFKVAIIPHTFENTVFKYLRVGSSVNIEIDMIAKYVESLLRK
ncbi:MAG: riboflavin synthase [Bacteroidetes bacterium]|nr:riboflavin synthase [Bacteroidota bacterium]